LLVEQIEQHPRKKIHVELLTRFDLESILAGVCELEALQKLLSLNSKSIKIEIRRTNNLHAKYFIFDTRSVIIGSSNMTIAAQSTNIEMGFFTTSCSITQATIKEFEGYWKRGVTVDDDWIKLQEKLLAPFILQYQKMHSQLRGMMVLHSIRMPRMENNFLASLKQILKKAASPKGVSKTWIEAQMSLVPNNGFVDGGAKINVDKRINFLKVLDLVDDQDGAMVLTANGIKCITDDKLLLTKMVETFQILRETYNAVPATGFITFKAIANNPSQELRDAIHWLSAFGLIQQKRVGIAYHFKRKKSVLESILS